MTFTVQELSNAINGFVKYKWGKDGPIIPLNLTAKEKELFNACTRKGYAIKKGRPNVYAAYAIWCSIEKKPEVSILPKIKYADIEVDMITTDYCISNEGQELITRFIKNLSPERNEHINIGGTFSFCNFIMRRKAEQVAKKIIEIISNKKYLVSQEQYRQEQMFKRKEFINAKNEEFRKVGNKKEGYVYFIQAENRSIFKIGYSKTHPKRRMKTLQNSNPYDLLLRDYFYSIDCEEAEKKVHQYFKEIPRKREWFFVSAPQVMEAIKYFKSFLDIALDSDHFNVISGKYIVLKSKVSDDGISVITEKCPFCGKRHRHGTGEKDYTKAITIKDGIKTIGHRVAHCDVHNKEFILSNGLIVNNNDGYYLGL